MATNTNNSQVSLRNTIGGVIGNVLEWYDFAVFGYFAPIIAEKFFPSADPIASLINAFGVFAAGYLVRPIGGIVFGHLGDRLGRKYALQLSVMIMVVPTTLLGLLPTYSDVGILAPILLIIIRLVQGFSVGGELIGSVSYMTEVAPPSKRGFLGSFSFMGAVGGVLLGSLVATIAHGLFDSSVINEWGWRVPFLFGFLVGAFGLWMRKGLVETTDFKSARERGQIAKNPVKEVIRRMPLRIIHLIGLIFVNAGAFYTIFVWWPTYIGKIIEPPIQHAFIINTLAMIFFMLLLPLFGLLSDYIGRRKMMISGIIVFIAISYPLFVWTDQGILIHALATQFIFTLVMATFSGPLAATMIEMFPTNMRYSGIAIGYNFAQSLVGGTSPLICTWLISRTNNISSPAFYITALGAISLVAAYFLSSKYGDEVKG